MIGAHASQDSDSELDYQKLYTTHKFQVVEDTSNNPEGLSQGLKQAGIKSTPKTLNNVTPTPKPNATENNTTIPTPHQNGSQGPTQNDSLPPVQSQPEKKRGRPSNKDKEKEKEKEKDSSNKDGDEKKKRKPKEKKGEDSKPSSQPQSQQAVPPQQIMKNETHSNVANFSPAKDPTFDKLRKVEETISKYENFNDLVMGGNFINDNFKNLVSQIGIENPMRGLPPFPQPGATNPGYQGGDNEQISYNKIFQDLLKNPSLSGMMNFYPQNFNNK